MNASASSVAAVDDLEPSETLDEFFVQVQARALTMARLAVGCPDQALDLVQDAMVAFVRRYRHRPAEERRPLFYRVLENRIRDWYRKRARRGRWMLPWDRSVDANADGPDRLVVAEAAAAPDGVASDEEFSLALERALKRLPLRQRQVFLLRAWEGLSVAETAQALGVGQGSVKTHYFRAMASLRQALEDYHD